jgi:hypothetical protein
MLLLPPAPAPGCRKQQVVLLRTQSQSCEVELANGLAKLAPDEEPAAHRRMFPLCRASWKRCVPVTLAEKLCVIRMRAC